MPCVCGQERVLDGAYWDHISWTGYWSSALFALHGVRDIGQKTGYESARTWRGSYGPLGCQTSVLLDSRLSALRIIETFSKRSCSLLSCIVPCLLHRIPEKRISAQQHSHSHVIVLKTKKKRAIRRFNIGRSSSLLRT